MLACLLFQALTQLQAEIEGAQQLLNSIVSAKATSIDASTKANKAKTRLENALGTVTVSGLVARSPVAVTAKQLISDLDVTACYACTYI